MQDRGQGVQQRGGHQALTQAQPIADRRPGVRRNLIDVGKG